MVFCLDLGESGVSQRKETLNDDAWPLSSSPKKVIVAHDQEVAENGVNNSFGAAAGSGCRGWSDLVRKGGLGLRVSQGLLQGKAWAAVFGRVAMAGMERMKVGTVITVCLWNMAAERGWTMGV
ncbi:hypothetical protein NC652_029402 [Populus alba x Populus x berolinensis]|nr:hypothetical protein NC652_029402 [Populus alba x Populus x berolinensis]